MALVKRILKRLSRTAYVRSALAHPVDPAELRRRPNRRERLGLGLVAFSYLIGWPAVAFLAYLAYHLHQPLVVAIGGPVIYGISHVVFLVGAWLAGARYMRRLLRFATRRAYERFLPEKIPEAVPKAAPTSIPERVPRAIPEAAPAAIPEGDDGKGDQVRGNDPLV